MEAADKLDVIRQVMGASHVFCTAVSELLERTLTSVTDKPLAMSQVKLLLLISRPGQTLKVTDVAAFLDVTNAAASRAVDRLVQRELVDRSVSPEDRRAVQLSLTPAGQEVLDRFTEARNERLYDLLGDVPEEKLRQVTTLLDDLSVRLLDLGGEEEDRCLRCGIHFRKNCVVRDVLGRECVVSGQLYGEDDEAATGS